MNLNDIGKIGKILKDSQEINRKSTNKITTDFSKILDEEINNKSPQVKGTSNIIPSQQLLNIKDAPTQEIFIKKGFEQLDKLTDTLEKFKNILSKDELDTPEANNLINDLRETIGNLNTIVEAIKEPFLKSELNRAMLIANVEVEKYLRGDYF